jgi:hypothetical protein
MINLVIIVLLAYVAAQVPRFVNINAKRTGAADLLHRVLTGNIIQPKENERVKVITEEISRLKTEAEQLNSTATFVKHTKCMRQITKLKTELESLSKDKPTTSTTKASWMWWLVSLCTGFAFIYQTEQTSISGESLWPLDSVLGVEVGGSYHLSLWVWYFMCLYLSFRLT